ncbi:hypothetical protein [Pseudanabaena sp. Chao 1811]|nr:hypothetical protein [Pseudanabaena sp. Chao 1811]
MKLENNNERPLLEATLENIEVIFDIASDGNFWSEVPVVNVSSTE